MSRGNCSSATSTRNGVCYLMIWVNALLRLTVTQCIWAYPWVLWLGVYTVITFWLKWHSHYPFYVLPLVSYKWVSPLYKQILWVHKCIFDGAWDIVSGHLWHLICSYLGWPFVRASITFEVVWQFLSVMFLRQLSSTGIIWSIYIHYILFWGVWVV